MASSPGQHIDTRGSAWRLVALLFLLGLGVRLLALAYLVPENHVLPHTRWEMQAIAASLYERGEFADPYAIPTGPTAHLPPVYPTLVALIYLLMGRTLMGGYMDWLLRLAADAAMYALLPWFAVRVGIGRWAGMLGGIAGCFLVLWPGHGEALTGVVMALLLVAFLRRWTGDLPTWRASLGLGLAAGASFHLQPALLPVVAGCVIFELARRRRDAPWRPAAVLTLGAVLACVPWAWRNHAVLGGHFFVRSNFGLELRMGNHDGAAAHMDVMDARGEFRHPRTQRAEAELVRDLGEVEYMRRAQREALDWIAANPLEFLRLTASRVLHVWFGPLHDPAVAAATTLLTLLALLGAWLAFPGMSAVSTCWSS